MGRYLADIAVSNTGFVFDPSTGQTFWLNKTGLFIVKMLQAGVDMGEIVEKMLQEFSIDRDTALEDAREFLSLMIGMGFKINAT